MAKNLGVIGCLVLVCSLLIGARADTHIVGNSIGWNIPPLGEIAYRTWARGEDFQIGDTIEFRWNGTHDVAQVSRADYDSCSSANAIGQIQTTSPANFTLNSTEPHYFICTVGGHCRLGQKVTITVGSYSAASTLTASAFAATLTTLAISFLGLM